MVHFHGFTITNFNPYCRFLFSFFVGFCRVYHLKPQYIISFKPTHIRTKMGSLENGVEQLTLLDREEQQEEEEPILKEQNQRFCMFPIRYKQLWEMYKKAQASFWTGTFLTFLVFLVHVFCVLFVTVWFLRFNLCVLGNGLFYL